MAPAQPPRAPRRAAIDSARAAAAKLLQGWQRARAWARQGTLRILLRRLPRAGPQTPPAVISSSPLFDPTIPGDCRSPALTAPLPLATLRPPLLEGERAPNKTTRRCPRARTPAWVVSVNSLPGYRSRGGEPVSLTGLLEPRPPPPPTQPTCHPRPRYSGQRDSGGSPTRAPRSLGRPSR